PTYHYLTAETFRSTKVSIEQFWRMSKTEQADLVWKTLFVENTPTSEAARGFFKSRRLAEHIDQVIDIARVSGIVITNDPLDETEARIWNSSVELDHRFKTSMRLDRLLNDWHRTAGTLSRRGISVNH